MSTASTLQFPSKDAIISYLQKCPLMNDLDLTEKKVIKAVTAFFADQTPPPNEELKPLSSQAKSIEKGADYEHYKGNRYKILSVGRNSETLEESVVYQALYGDHDVWIRPLNMFLENVVINGQTQPRFKKIQ